MNQFTLTTLLLTVSLPAFAGGSSTVGPGNPSAYFCVNNGGTLESYRSKLGQEALCTFGRNGGIEQWTFLRAKTEPQMAVEFFFHPKKVVLSARANPASLYCRAQGGETTIVTVNDGGQIGVCEFEDGSAIEEWTLLRGASDPSNAELVKALR